MKAVEGCSARAADEARSIRVRRAAALAGCWAISADTLRRRRAMDTKVAWCASSIGMQRDIGDSDKSRGGGRSPLRKGSVLGARFRVLVLDELVVREIIVINGPGRSSPDISLVVAG